MLGTEPDRSSAESLQSANINQNDCCFFYFCVCFIFVFFIQNELVKKNLPFSITHAFDFITVVTVRFVFIFSADSVGPRRLLP